MKKDKLCYIQAIRGIASLSVVLFHSSRFLSPYGTGIGDTIFGPMSYMGVSIFFMISGLIMVTSTTSSNGSMKYTIAFMIKRFCRIWPIYVIATVVYIYLRKGLLNLSDTQSITILLKSILFIPISNSPAPVFGFPSLVVGWTLNYEIFFYLLFAISLLFDKRKWFFLLASSITLLIAIPGFNGVVSFAPKTNYGFSSPFIGFLTSPIIWLFFIGISLGLVHESNLKINSKKIGLSLLIVSLLSIIIQYTFKYRIGHGIFECGLTLIPFLFISIIYFKSFNDFTPSFLAYLGNISFSLYLWHPVVQENTPKITQWFGINYFSSGFPAILITTIVSILIAIISKRILEDLLCNKIRDTLLKILAGLYKKTPI